MSNDAAYINDVLGEVAPNLDKNTPKASEAEPPQKKTPAEEGDEGDAQPSGKKPARKEDFDEEDYQNEEDDNFDPATATPEQKKRWPKKYVNALSRRDQTITKLRSDLAAKNNTVTQQPAPKPSGAAEGNAQPQQAQISPADQAKIDAVMQKKPDISKYKDFGEYNEAVIDWKQDVRDVQNEIKNTAREAEKTQTSEQDAVTAQNEVRITNQAKEFIQKYPEALQLVQANADVIDALPEHVTNALADTANPEMAMFAILNVEGALQTLSTLNAKQAERFIWQAEQNTKAWLAAQEQSGGENENEEGEDSGDAEGTQQPKPQTKTASNAPAPLKKTKSAPSGKKQLGAMDADEIFDELDLHNI